MSAEWSGVGREVLCVCACLLFCFCLLAPFFRRLEEVGASDCTEMGAGESRRLRGRRARGVQETEEEERDPDAPDLSFKVAMVGSVDDDEKVALVRRFGTHNNSVRSIDPLLDDYTTVHRHLDGLHVCVYIWCLLMMPPVPVPHHHQHTHTWDRSHTVAGWGAHRDVERPALSSHLQGVLPRVEGGAAPVRHKQPHLVWCVPAVL